MTPHIVVPDAGEGSAWYVRAFGAHEISRVPLPGDHAMSVQVQIGESTIHIGSEFPAAGILSPRSIGGTATVLQITTEDAQAIWRRALGAGAKEHHALAEQFWGELHGQLIDPFGHCWNIAQRIRNVPLEEIVAAAAEIFGQIPEGSKSSDG